MRIPGMMLAAAAAAMLALAAPTPSQAKKRTHFSFGYYGPGVSIHIGRYPRYYYGPYYYRPYAYRPYYYRPYVYRPYYGGGRCSYWSQRCAANWGIRNSNYYGCMRYHGCR